MGDFEENIDSLEVFLGGNIDEVLDKNDHIWRNRPIKGDTSDLKLFIDILSIEYSTTDYSAIEAITKQERSQWSIKLYLSAKENLKQTQDFIEQTALPIIKKWGNTPRADTWFLNRHRLQIGVNKDISRFCVFETQEDRIVNKLFGNM